MCKKLLLPFWAAIFLVACDKDDTNPISSVDDGACFIRGWHDTSFFDSVRNSVFTYNEYGDPISIESQFCCTGTEPDFFTYDLKRRLIKYEHYSLITHFYDYNEEDSLPITGTEVWGYGQRYELTFSYDNNQRLQKATRKYLYTENLPDPLFYDSSMTENTVIEYVYDSKGNLVNDVISSSDYIDKPSLYRTNKWWMFIHRNYSMNALKVGSDYNECGYPLKTDKQIFLSLGPGTIDYERRKQ